MKTIVLAAAFASPAMAAILSGTASHFTAPQQPWTSSDRQVRLLRPAVAQSTSAQAPLGSLMTPGWRLNWVGKPDRPGTIATRLTLPVQPSSGRGRMTEVLQVGWSSAPAALATCRVFGLDGASRKNLPPRTINGISFEVVANSDSGMSQSIDATDFRSVVGRRCYAIERFSYAVEAADPDPAARLTEKQGAAMLDAALASLHLGPGQPLATPQIVTPTYSVAR